MSDAPDSKRDWRDTVFLPKTDFPMKAGLPAKEPGILARWQADGLYRQLRTARAGREKFILHDGPPYANGDMHIGHAMQRIVKDMVVRTQTLLGKDAPFVPGWDCHGLPIEWKVEEEYRKKKRNKDEVPVEEFRAECRAYAQKWVDIQREQIKRLGALGDWDHPYLTMDFEAEATIVAELLKFAESGQLYRGAKPVMWSPVEKTALAEAEVEYEDITSTQIDVAFEIVEAPNAPELVGAHAVIWTTTPWTIPVNQAIAYGPDVEYVLVRPLLTYATDDEKQFDAVRATIQGALPWFLQIDKLIVAKDLAQQLASRLTTILASLDLGGIKVTFNLMYGENDPANCLTIKGSDLVGAKARHPMAKLFAPLPPAGGVGGGPVPVAGAEEVPTPNPSREREGDALQINPASPLAEFFTRPRPFLPGDFVTTDAGTGLVHMSPDHGEDDFDLCKKHGIEPAFAVDAAGMYRADWAWLGGQGSVINKKFTAADGPICADLRAAGALLAASDDFQHSYPHSWRSKAKVIYRCTPQWFVPMDKVLDGASTALSTNGVGGAMSQPPFALSEVEGQGTTGDTLRNRALAAIAATRFVPDKGRNRLGSMVSTRPDWVLSRQRAWGVPITLFVNRASGDYLRDMGVNARIIAAVRDGGVDAWNSARAQEFLGADYRAEDYEQVADILDVWFDSGCTHAFVLESGRWAEQRWPADLYLEGSDQHRGWFQSSLLETCGTRGRAPYKTLLTHGFTMDAAGRKMSKSLGNTINPLDLMRDYGADILRLWALSVDFTEDHRIGDEILKGVADQYRKLRNTFRYLLGALEGFGEDERVAAGEMPELERYLLALLGELDVKLRAAIDDYDFNSYTRLLSDFANNDLSAFYFDIRKDCLYCDVNPATGKQTTKRRACRTVMDMVFHALVRWAAPVLVFTAEEVWGTRYPEGGSVHLLEWPELPVAASSWDWGALRALRAEVTQAIEPLRRDKVIGSSLEAEVWTAAAFPGVDLAEIFISAEVHSGDAERIARTTHHKCGRCWRHLPEVGEDGDLCGRCAEMVA